ncbi:MAG: hypothetical protein FH753_01740 [Firmicutes bacterium]|nr:hypothetical protein [Bacillota bacterium]
MKKIFNKGNFYLLVLFIIIITARHYFVKYHDGYSELKDRLFYDFEDFASELETLNDNISQVLALNNFDFNKEFINKNVIHNYMLSNYDAEELGDKLISNDYIDIYYINDLMKNIVSDQTIGESERNFLKHLYSYNELLIKEHKKALGDYKGDFDKQEKLKKDIVKIYNDYSKKADDLLKSKYSFLENYKGDFNKGDFDNAKVYCEEIFSKLVKDKTLKYDKSNSENTDKYVFKTSLENKGNLNNGTVYSVTFDKKTKSIIVKAIQFIKYSKDKNYIEEKLDTRANNIISRFNNNLSSSYKEIKYDKEGNIDSIKYSYIKIREGVYDKRKEIKLVLQSNGLITDFQIIYPSDEKIKMPRISKEEILNKINKEVEIIDILTVRNIKKEIEYEVHLKYNNRIYTAIYDGVDGELKYYGKELRNYKYKKKYTQ